MSWVKIDDQFPSHPKVVRAGLEARALYITSLCYSAQHLTDGFVTHEVTPLLTAMSQITNGPKAIEKLLEVGLWELCEGGYMIHDYLVYNPDGAKIRAERKANKERQARFRGYSNANRNAVTNAVTNALPVPVPVPLKDIADKPQKASSKPKTKRQNQHDTAIDSLVECFTKSTSIACPNGNGPKGTTAIRWYAPLNRLLSLCGKDTSITSALIESAVKQMRHDHLTISAPQSIEKVAISIFGESHSGNSKPQEFYT